MHATEQFSYSSAVCAQVHLQLGTLAPMPARAQSTGQIGTPYLIDSVAGIAIELLVIFLVPQLVGNALTQQLPPTSLPSAVTVAEASILRFTLWVRASEFKVQGWRWGHCHNQVSGHHHRSPRVFPYPRLLISPPTNLETFHLCPALRTRPRFILIVP